MAAPRRPNTGGRRAEQRPILLALRVVARRAWAVLTVCGWLGTLSGCAWWREASDSVAYSQGLYRRALECETQGDGTEAARLLRESISASPNDPELRWELARVLIDQGDTPAALQELRYLVKYHPDDSRAYMSLARTLLERGRADDAARLADLAIDLDSRCTEALILRAQIAEVRNDIETARETYHRLLLDQPEHADVRLRLGRIELEHGDSRIAAAFLRETLADVPLTPDQAASAHWLLGTAYAREERWSEAVASLSLGLPHPKATPEQHYQLAYACLQMGDRERAQRQLDVLLRTAPGFGPAQQMLAALGPPAGLTETVERRVIPTNHAQVSPGSR